MDNQDETLESLVNAAVVDGQINDEEQAALIIKPRPWGSTPTTCK